MAATVKHRRSTGLPADNAVPAQIQPSNFADSHVLAGALADRQVAGSVAANADGWDWLWLRDSDLTATLTNLTGAGLVLGDVVARTHPSNVGLDDTLSSQGHFVVCAEATLGNTVAGRFWGQGVIPTVKNQGAVTAGHYLRKSATSKAVESTGVAAGPTVQPPSGALGLALSTNAGSGVVSVLWFPRPLPFLPPVTAGYLKGTGTGFSVQAAPIPIGDISTGSPTGAKFLRDDGVLAVPPGGGGGSDPILDRNTSGVTVANTVTETDLYSFNVLGGLLASTKKLRLTLTGTITDTTIGSTKTATVRFKYGATTVASVAINTAIFNSYSDGGCPPTTIEQNLSVGSGSAFKFVGELDALTAGTQDATATLALTEPVSLGFAAPALFYSLPVTRVARGTAALASGSDQTLKVTWQWSTAAAARTMTRVKAVLELL